MNSQLAIQYGCKIFGFREDEPFDTIKELLEASRKILHPFAYLSAVENYIEYLAEYIDS